MSKDTDWVGGCPVFIVGLPGCGKTTFGRALSHRLKREFIDLDFYISQRFRKSVTEIFSTEGEEGFRQKEQAMLREVGELEGTVIACGGGTPCYGDNMAYMLSRGLTVWLSASTSRIHERLKEGKARRPLLRHLGDSELESHISGLLAARAPYYSQAAITHEGTHLENRAEIASAVEDFIRLHGDKL